MSRASLPLLAWFVSASGLAPVHADEFAWELSAAASRYELEPILETDGSSLGATYFFGGVDDTLGPYALASFLDPTTRIGATVAREDQTSYPIGPGSATLPPFVSRTDRYSVAGRYVFPTTKWYVGGRYERPDLDLPPPATQRHTEREGYGAVLGKYLGPRTSIELHVNRSEIRSEDNGLVCITGSLCTISGSLFSKQTTDDVALAAAHARQFRSLTYRLSGRVAQTSDDVVLHASAFEVPILLPPLPPGLIVSGPLPPSITVPAQTIELDLGTFRVYSTAGELFPTTKLGVRVGYSRWDGDTSIDDAYDVGITWFVRRDLAVGASLLRQTNGDSSSFRHAETLSVHLTGRL